MPREPQPPSRPPIQTDTTGDIAEVRLLRRFRIVFNAVKTHFKQVEKQAGIGGAQLWALSIVAARPGVGISSLAATMDVHQTTASNLVKGLVKGELVITERSGPDRRAVQLLITAAGARVLAKAPGPFAGVLPDAIARLDARTLKRLDKDLQQLIELLKVDERAASIPLADL